MQQSSGLLLAAGLDGGNSLIKSIPLGSSRLTRKNRCQDTPDSDFFLLF